MEERREGTAGPAGEKAARARRFVEELLRRMGAAIAVEVRDGPEAIGLALRPGAGNAIEPTPALVEAIQALANLVVNPEGEPLKWVNVEVGGFGEEAEAEVRAMALRLAATVRRTGRTVAIGPISARDRRLIHLALLEEEGVATESEGEGLFRQLLVEPFAGPKRPAVRE